MSKRILTRGELTRVQARGLSAHVGKHYFGAEVDGDHARSTVTSVSAPAEYSFRQVHTVLELARRESSKELEGTVRVTRLPSGTCPGFLAAVAELIHRHVEEWRVSGQVQPGGPINHVYHGRIYELRATDTRPLARVQVGSATGITLALARRMRSLCWSAVGIVFVLMRSTWRPGASVAVAISSVRP